MISMRALSESKFHSFGSLTPVLQAIHLPSSFPWVHTWPSYCCHFLSAVPCLGLPYIQMTDWWHAGESVDKASSLASRWDKLRGAIHASEFPMGSDQSMSLAETTSLLNFFPLPYLAYILPCSWECSLNRQQALNPSLLLANPTHDNATQYIGLYLTVMWGDEDELDERNVELMNLKMVCKITREEITKTMFLKSSGTTC